jgi:hypothetical protein
MRILGPFTYPSLVTTDSPIVKAILLASEVMLGKPVVFLLDDDKVELTEQVLCAPDQRSGVRTLV